MSRPLGSSLFLSGPSSEFSQQTRTPLFHNVSHVLNARREMVAGTAPGGSESVFAPSAVDASGPELLAARARTLGFVSGNMFGASAGSDDAAARPVQRRDSGSSNQSTHPASGLRPSVSASELVSDSERRRSGGEGGGVLSFIGSLGASIPRHELAHTPGWDPRASDSAAKQLRAGLGFAAPSAPAGTPAPRPTPHVPFPRGLLLPSTVAHPHVSLHTLAEREHDVMARWPATMAAAAEMKLRALIPPPHQTHRVLAAAPVKPISAR
jgi:hypothetical protein